MGRVILMLKFVFTFAIPSFSQSSYVAICPGDSKALSSGLEGSSFRWEVNRGNGFEWVLDTGNYSGATTAALLINPLTSEMRGYVFRCIGDTGRTGLFSILVSNTWIGGESPFWEDAGNWSCGEVPDSATDVNIPSGNISIQNNIKIKSLHVAEDVKLTIAEGAEILITGLSGPSEPFSLLDEELALLDSIGAENPDLIEMEGFLTAQVGLDDVVQNSTAEAQVEKFINHMIGLSWILSNQKEKQFPDEGDFTHKGITIHRPAHWGYAYRFGSRQYTERKILNQGDDLHKKYAVFGLDCSGFLFQLLNNAGLPVSDEITTSNLFGPIKKALETTPDFKYIDIVDKGKLELKDLKNGDILLWGGHTGIFFNSNSKGPLVYQSNGTGTPLTQDPCKEYNYETKLRADGSSYKVKTTCKIQYTQNELEERKLNDQLKNLGKTRGIHPIKFASAINKDAGYWGPAYVVLRFEPFEVITNPAPTSSSNQTLSESITDTTAILGGEVLSDGGSPVQSRGICYSTNLAKNPTVFNLTKVEGNELGSFTTTIDKLLPGTKYAARAYAINQTDTAYGNTIVFDTKGQMDTVATLIAHGLWNAYFWGDDMNASNKLGVLQSRNLSTCPDVITWQYQLDKIQFTFNADTTGDYRELEYVRSYSWESTCIINPEPVFTTYEWFHVPTYWEYNRATRTMTFYLGTQGAFAERTMKFVIHSISADELTGNYYDSYPGEPDDYLGFLRLR